MSTTDRSLQLDDLIGTSISEFDIADDVRELAVSRHEAVGAWLDDYWGATPSNGAVYPQGSFRLGTVVRPITPGAEYDIDLVCRRDLAKSSTTQKDLKFDVGHGLGLYVASSPDGSPSRSEGKRCWTLEYPHEPFHMDVLPALPDPDGVANAILLTDRELREWQHSNPIDYATWFHRRMERELVKLREAAAMAKRMDVADVPEWKVKSTLQRTVQALKRHRDVRFAETPKVSPASIIISTLAAKAYRDSGSLYDVLVDVTTKMPGLVEQRDGVYWVANPVQPEENFADRWRSDPARARAFFDWVALAAADFSDYGAELGVDRVLEKVSRTLGQAPARFAGERLGVKLAGVRDAGALTFGGGTGMLGATGGRRVPSHTFHGDAPKIDQS